jgi:hypothetical protein
VLKENLLSRALEAQINTETEEQRRKLGLLMRRRIVGLIDMPREAGEYEHLIPTRGKTFEGEVELANERLMFKLESDHEDTAQASGISFSIPVLGETMLLLENGDTEMRVESTHPSSQRTPADIFEMARFYGFLGLIESQFPHTDEYPPGIIPFPKK